MQTVTTEIEMVEVDSSNLEQIGYDKQTKTLRLKFLDSAVYYDFEGVPQRLYRGLLAADSKGHFFREKIQFEFGKPKKVFPK